MLIGSVGGPTHLAEFVLLSYPPQVGSGVEVRGLALDRIPEPPRRREGDVMWCDGATVSGALHDGVLDADELLVDGVAVPLGGPGPP